MTIVIAVCAAIGAIAGIAGSAAAPSSSSSAQAQKKAAQAQKRAVQRKFRQLKRAFRAGGGPAARFGPGGPGFEFGFGPVHAEAVVPNADGTGFVTITTDAGTLNSVDGNTVHLKEGTDKKVYKDDVAIDVGSNAKVIRNRADAKLTDLKPGDHVRVITGAPKGNIVIAQDDAFIQQQKKQFQERAKKFQERAKKFRERGFRHGGFGPGWGPPGPPPGAPAPPSGSNQNGSYPGIPGDGANS